MALPFRGWHGSVRTQRWECAPPARALAAGLPPPRAAGWGRDSRDRADRRAAILSLAGGVAPRPAQLGSDDAALWFAQRARLGDWRFHGFRLAGARRRSARRGDGRYQPAARAVCGRAAAFYPLLTIHTGLYRHSLYPCVAAL